MRGRVAGPASPWEWASLGCGAVNRPDASHAELEPMRTSTARERSGIASRLLGHIIAEAEAEGMGFPAPRRDGGWFAGHCPVRQ